MRKGILLRLYRHSKAKLNYLLDRIIDLCDMVLMDAHRLPWSAAQNTAKKIARYVGDISWLLRAFPRLSAYELAGTDWKIIFAGTDEDLLEIRHLFFPEEEVTQQELGRIAVWRLSGQTQRWLAEGIDLVICELGRIHPNRPKALITFTVPTWIQQVLAIPEPLESLIAGKKSATERHRLNKAKRTGFSYRFGQSKADFDHFYYHMYLPYVKTRHGDLALTAPYQDQWQRWFVRGGLVLAIQHDKPLAGVLCYIANNTCFDIERGVLGADPQLFKQGIETVITWYAIAWAHGQGAKTYDMGGTHAWHSNGSFNAKRRWGAHVVRRKRIYGTWTFLARNLSPSLQDHLNRLGFITETDGKFYGVLLNSDTNAAEETDLHNKLSAAHKQGLTGLAVVSPNAEMVVYDSAS
jgi:hypothetical protein